MSATSPSGRGWGGLQAVLLALAWTLLAVWAVGIAVAGWQRPHRKRQLARCGLYVGIAGFCLPLFFPLL